MTILKDISVIWSLIHVMLLFFTLFESRYPKRKTVVLTAALVIPWVTLNMTIYVFTRAEEAAMIMLFTATVPAMIFFMSIARYRDGRLVFTFCFVGTVSYAVIVLTSIIEYYLFGNQYIFMLCSRLVAFPVMEYLSWKYLRRYYWELQETVKKGWGTFAAVSALLYVLQVIMSAYPVIFYENPGQTPALLIVVVLMVVMYINVFKVLYHQQQIFYAREEERRLNQQTQLLHNELEAEQEYVYHAKRFLHDLRHHGRLIIEYLENGEVEEAKNYLRRYYDHVSGESLQGYCKNRTVNALLRITQRRCAEKEVEFSFEGAVPEKLPLTEPETGTVFGNLLDNAIEACEKCENGKKLQVKSEVRKNVLYVEIRNSVDGKVKFDGDMPRSTKQTGGLGLRSVNTVLARCDGMMTNRQEKERFITRVVLPL